MTDLSQIAEQEWNEAHRRAAVLRPLLELKPCPREKAREAAAELGLSDRQVYRLILRLRESGDELTTLLPGGSNGGQGKPRLAAPRENLLQRLIAEIYVTRQKRSAADLVLAIRSQSLKAGLDPPSDTKYYHLRPHEGMDGEMPLRRYEQGLLELTAANKAIPIPRDPAPS